MKKLIFLFFSLISSCQPTMADFQRLEDDALTTEKADETAQIINNNFSNFWASKVDVSTPAASGPSFFVSDLLNPEMSDRNTQIILDEADALWREKNDFNGIHAPGGRTITITDISDPEQAEENISAINEMFEELDEAKVDAQ